MKKEKIIESLVVGTIMAIETPEEGSKFKKPWDWHSCSLADSGHDLEKYQTIISTQLTGQSDFLGPRVIGVT